MATSRQTSSRATLRPLLFTTASWAIVTAAIGLLWLLTGTRPMELFAEVVLLGEHWYEGSLSVLTVLVWGAGGALLLTVGWALCAREPDAGRALRALGAFTVLLVVDDAFGVHDHLLAHVAGVPEIAAFVCYGVIGLLVVARHGRVLLDRPESTILIAGVLALAASLAVDLGGAGFSGRHALEDVLKLLGASYWTLFGVLVCREAVRGTPHGRSASPAPTADQQPAPPVAAHR